MDLNRILNPKKALLDDQRMAGGIVTDILLELAEMTKPGVSLELLAELAERRIEEAGGEPCFKGYQPKWAKTPFPSVVCTSVEFEVCHGIPHNRILKEGEIISYDLGVKYKSGCGDACITIPVGEVNNRRQRAMRYGLEALYRGIKQVKAGIPISAIGKAIEDYCIENGYNVIKDFAGHHIGKEVHEKPYISHYYRKEDDNVFLKEGAVICIEPIITPGKVNIMIGEDKWTAYVMDGQPVVQYEMMVLVTADGYEILTNWDK